MRQLIDYQTLSGDQIFFEITPSKQLKHLKRKQDFGDIKDETDQIFKVTQGSIEKSLDNVLSIGEKVNESLKKLKPQKIIVEFGLSVTVESGVIISSVSGQANFKISLTWEQK